MIDSNVLLHDVKRPLLDFFVDPPDVLTENPDRNQLHPPQEQHAQDDRGESFARFLVVGEEGDEVIIFGQQLPVEQLAEWAGTIPYEIMTGVSQRVKRVYYEE